MNPPTSSLRVLVAEDNADHAFFTRRAFDDIHGSGVELSVVGDGEQLLAYLRGQAPYAGLARPHLVVLDLKMPKMGGLEVLEQLIEDSNLRTIPVVVLSSSDRPEDVSQSYARGANCYVTKPATLAGLREGVSELARYWVDIASLPEGT